MEEYLIAIKDVLVVIAPIIIAYISYRSNKKSKEDIQLEIEKSLKEKGAETSQIIQKINAELESQKQMVSWNNSMPQVNEYTSLSDTERYGNIGGLNDLIIKIRSYINTIPLTVDELTEIKNLLLKINLPLNEEHLFPYEIPNIINYNKLIRDIDEMISNINNPS